MQTARIKTTTMRTARIKGPRALRVTLGVLACCACDNAPNAGTSGGMSSQATTNQPAIGTDTFGSGGMSGRGSGGANAMGAAANAGNPAAIGSGGTASASAGAPATTGNGGTGNGSGGMLAAGGTNAAGAAGTTAPTQSIPTPVTTPYVWGVGIGVTDMPAAVKFYTEVMKMTVEQQDVRREDRTETVLVASEAKRGSRVVLMSFDDKRKTRNITAKLVWQAADPTGVSAAAASYPDYVSRLSGLIVQFDGPETYIQEVGNAFDTGGAGIAVPYLIALGMSVGDQTASINFYDTAFGMTDAPTGTFPLVSMERPAPSRGRRLRSVR